MLASFPGSLSLAPGSFPFSFLPSFSPYFSSSFYYCSLLPLFSPLSLFPSSTLYTPSAEGATNHVVLSARQNRNELIINTIYFGYAEGASPFVVPSALPSALPPAPLLLQHLFLHLCSFSVSYCTSFTLTLSPSPTPLDLNLFPHSEGYSGLLSVLRINLRFFLKQ